MRTDQRHVLEFVMNVAASGVGLALAVKQAALEFGMRERAIWDAIQTATTEIAEGR